MTTSPNNASDFLREVADRFTHVGYEVDLDYPDDQFGFLATLPMPFYDLRVAVKCVSLHKPVSIAEVEAFAGLAIRRTGIDILMIVSRSGFTAGAKDAATKPHRRLVLVTLDELEAQLIDFRSYLRGLIKHVDTIGLLDTYVPLRVCDATGAVRTGEEALNNWIMESNSSLLVIAGDAGSGKTTLCLILCYQLANRRLETNRGLIPILLTLRHFDQHQSLESAIAQHFAQTHGMTFSVPAFRLMLRTKQFILIFDGLDECTNPDQFINDVGALLAANPGAVKCIITSRPHASRKVQRSDIFELLPFTSEQIELFIAHSLAGRDPHKISELIKVTHNLLDLASVPIALSMITDSIISLGLSDLPINVAQLYETYTRTWIERDQQKGNSLSLSAATLSKLMERLAFHMFSASVLYISQSELTALLRDQLDITSVRDLDAVHNALRTCGFLHGDEAGRLSFVHKSFLEFFTAKYLHRLSATSTEQMSAGVVQFLNELATLQPPVNQPDLLPEDDELTVFAVESEDRRLNDIREEVAHEMGTPLGVVANAFTQLLDELPDDIEKRQHDTIGSIQTGIDRMKRLIGRIGTLSRSRHVKWTP